MTATLYRSLRALAVFDDAGISPKSGYAGRVRFYPHFHPYAEKLGRLFAEQSLSAFQDADTDETEFGERDLISSTTLPVGGVDYCSLSRFLGSPYPVKSLEFKPNEAYSVYNWELFFHIPLAVAIHLSRSQRFEEARDWFHYIFNPSDAGVGETPARFWKVKPFKTTHARGIQEVIESLTEPDADVALRQSILDSIDSWINDPFRPHVIARYRPWSYMYKTVMAYLDNLIAWGDDLFRQDTMETINEATTLYVLAANILGDRPQFTPKYDPTRSVSTTYKNLKAAANAAQRVAEQSFWTYQDQSDTAGSASSSWDPFSSGKPGSDDAVSGGPLATMFSFSSYFCVPNNDALLNYWDTVADRLFKIRNSLNIKGVFRQFPLYEPPIDPALLIRARAAGLDISKVVAGLNQPLPIVRYRLLIQKAQEICQEVKSLGGSLLSTLEKKDGEALSVLRARHERSILEIAESVKYGQWQEAMKSREGLEESFGNAVRRYQYYEMLLGRKANEIDVPELSMFEPAELEGMKLQLREPEMENVRLIKIDHAKNVDDQRKISNYEASDLKHLKEAQELNEKAEAQQKIVAEINKEPQVTTTTGFKLPDWGPLGTGVSVSYGSQQIAAIYAANAQKFQARAAAHTYKAGKCSNMGGYERREQEWAFQSNAAAGEITQTYKQLRAAQIREAIAEKEWKNHKQQIRNAEAIEQFLTDERKGKATNEAFYAWMKKEVSGLHAKCFDLAFDLAKKAELALQHELGNTEVSYIQPVYTSGKEGLLAGEKLHLDLKRMEIAYHELNEREYELTKHVSLLQIDPIALVDLRATGKCEFTLTEELFDFDGPGHYFRRIKSVALTIPCVTGPYTGVHCRLTLQRSRVRTSTSLADDYREDTTDTAGDSRFHTYRGNIQSIVASSGQTDSGLFEMNLNDERYLPFENSGVVSNWELKLPGDPSRGEPCQFDYNTISDAILHIRYTAREGGDRLRVAAIENLTDLIKGEDVSATGRVPMTRLFSVRHEYPTEWAAFKAGSSPVSLTFREEHYPYWSCRWLSLGELVEVRGFVREFRVIREIEGFSLGESATKPVGTGEFGNGLSPDSTDDLWIALTWRAN